MVTKTAVAVQRGREVEAMVQKALEMLGGVEELVPYRSRVLVKPNLVMEEPHSSGATTNPRVLEGILQELQKTLPREVVVGEGSAAVASTEKAFRVSGLDKVAEQFGAQVKDLKKGPFEKLKVPGGRELQEVQVARPLLEAEVVINLPVLKVHAQTKVTAALKNLKGCIHDQEKKRFHRLNLEQCIVDLNQVIPVHLIILDATLCSFAWEGGGSPVPMDTILAGTNPVAVDGIAAPIMGYCPEEIEHLRLAGEQGMGPLNRERIKVYNEEALDAAPLTERVEGLPSYEVKGLQVVEKGTCTPCMGGHLAALRRLNKEGAVLPGTVFLGQLLEEEDLKQGKGTLLGVGNCGASLVGKENSVSGCPPEGRGIYEFYKEKAR